MIKKILHHWKLILGLLFSLLFLYLAFRRVEFKHMAAALTSVDYWYVLPTVAVILLSLWLRAWRWRYFLLPLQNVGMTPLFNSLLIGYLFNIFLPAHLGEIVRAFVLARKTPLTATAVFGTIVIERIIDVLAMLLLLAAAMIVYPFPQWVKTGGYLTSALVVLLFVLLVLMKKYRTFSLRLLDRIIRPLSAGLAARLTHMLDSFIQGILPLQKKSHILIVALQSIALWACYGLIFQLVLHAFDFIHLYHLPWTAALVLLVITTFGVLVPSSPGYVGTYHYLCQVSLGLFGVPASPALTYAIIMHGINFFPVLILGLIILSKEGLSISSVRKETGA